jgi:hypothetical protein
MDASRACHVLGISPGAGKEAIRTNYRDLVQVWHPDRFSGNDRLRRKAEEQLREINEAYAVLIASGDASYDQPPAAPTVTPSGRTTALSNCLRWRPYSFRRPRNATSTTSHLLAVAVTVVGVTAVLLALNALAPKLLQKIRAGAGTALDRAVVLDPGAGPSLRDEANDEAKRMTPPSPRQTHVETRLRRAPVSTVEQRGGMRAGGALHIRNDAELDAIVRLVTANGRSTVRIARVTSRATAMFTSIPIGRYYVVVETLRSSSGLLGPVDFLEVQSSSGTKRDEYTVVIGDQIVGSRPESVPQEP